MRSAVTLSLVPEARGGPFVFWDDLDEACRCAAALGFDAIEIFPPEAGAVDTRRLHTLLREHSLQVAAIGTGGGWVTRRWHLLHADPEVRGKARAFIREIVELAAEFTAPAIIGSMQGRVDPPDSRETSMAWLRESLEDLGEHAATLGQPLLYEPLNRYETNLFNRVADTAAFLDILQTGNVKILADLFHMNIEEACLATALRGAARHLGHVHFADSNRRAMGFGHTDPVPVISALSDIGYRGYLSAEVFPLPDSNAAAAQAIQAYREYTTQA